MKYLFAYIELTLNTFQSSGRDTNGVNIVKKHFNAIVAENCMKCQTIHPQEDRYNFRQADEFVKFGEDNGLTVTGHCLIWHSQLAPWFCVDKDGNNVSPEVLIGYPGLVPGYKIKKRGKWLFVELDNHFPLFLT